MTLSVNYSRFSRDARASFALKVVATPTDQFQLSGSYMAHVQNGIYVTPKATTPIIRHSAFITTR